MTSDSLHDPVASQMQMVVNHSVAMSAEASNVILLGRKAITKDLDKFSLEHGQVMAKDARVFLGEVIKSKEMQMLTRRRSKDLMADVTLELSKAASKVIGTLEKRPDW